MTDHEVSHSGYPPRFYVTGPLLRHWSVAPLHYDAPLQFRPLQNTTAHMRSTGKRHAQARACFSPLCCLERQGLVTGWGGEKILRTVDGTVTCQAAPFEVVFFSPLSEG